MKYLHWNNVRLVLMMMVVVTLYAFSGHRNSTRKLAGSQVTFTGDENLFLTEDAVNKLLIEKNSRAQSIQRDWVDLNRLEKAVEKHRMVEKSEVFVSIDGVLKAVVKQKTPIARVFVRDSSYYVDSKGNVMPLSSQYTARVPVVSGDVTPGKIQEVAGVLKMIHDDEFLKQNIIGVKVLASGAMEMENRNFDFAIDYGKPVNIKRKFANYKAFFQKAAADSTIKKYKKISLRFSNQVVCTK
jgi:cell division protein FtsQ